MGVKLNYKYKTIKMSREISLFTDYVQKENRVTNYCGLMMKLVYEESPKRFEELIVNLIQNDIDIPIGPFFSQQIKKNKSIPDLIITQKSISIFFETKLNDWFYSSQIKKHIEGFSDGSDRKILFLLSNFESDNLEQRFAKDFEIAEKNNIILQPLSYEDFINSLEAVAKTEYLSNLIEEFKVYLDSRGLLPKWKYLLDVVNCSGTLHEIKDLVYMCPDKGGAYSHRRAKYFAPYKNKGVRAIYEIDAIVIVGKNAGEGTIKWNNSNFKKEQLIETAKKKILKWDNRIEENKSVPLQVFLLSNPHPTSFLKSTKGGMLQSKKYFWNIAEDVKDSKELANKLNERKWEDFK